MAWRSVLTRAPHSYKMGKLQTEYCNSCKCLHYIWLDLKLYMLYNPSYHQYAKMAVQVFDWLIQYLLLPLQFLYGFRRNLTGSKDSMSSTKFVYFRVVLQQKMAALASDYLTYVQPLSCNHCMDCDENLQEARFQCPLPNQMHSNDLEACWNTYWCFWFHSKVKLANVAQLNDLLNMKRDFY